MHAMGGRPIAFICAMPMELEPLTRDLGLVETELDGHPVHTGRVGERDVVAIVTGMGTRLAAQAVERLLDAYDVDHLLVVGIAGAGVGGAPIGTVVLPEVVVHGPSGREHRPTRLGDAAHAGHMWTNDELITELEDLAASISVITKEQMADFALLDANDIFLYETGTEGTGQYTACGIMR